MRYFAGSILAILITVAVSAAETVRYFDYATEEEITEGEIGGRRYMVVTYDERGNSIVTEAYEIDGKPMTGRDGHRIEKEYDEKGRVTATRKYDTNGEPIQPGPLPKYFARVTYDEFSNKDSISFFTYDGEPTVNNSGVHRQVEEFIGEKKSISKSYFGVNGEPVAGFADIHFSEIEYDENGFACAYSYYGIEDEPIKYLSFNYHRLEEDKDNNDRIIERRYYGVGGEATTKTAKDDVHRVTYKYSSGDPRTFDVIEESTFGIDGQPVTKDEWMINFRQMFYLGIYGGVNLKDIHRVEVEYYKPIYPKSACFFDTDGKPKTDPYGVHRYEYTWADDRKITSHVCINYDGDLINGQWEGYLEEIWKYDTNGNLIERGIYGGDGEPLATRDGVHKIILEYDGDEKINKVGLDANNEPCDGWYRLR